MTIAVVDGCRAHVQVADDDHLAPRGGQLSYALLEHQVVVHLVRKSRVGTFIRTV